MKYIVLLLNGIFLYCSCNQTSNNFYEIKKTKYGDTIIIDSLLKNKICSKTAFIDEKIYVYINYEKKYKLKYNNEGIVIKKFDFEKNFEYRFYNNGNLNITIKKDSFDKVYYFNEYDSINSKLIDIYRHINSEITILDNDTHLFIPKIHTKFDNIEKYTYNISYDSAFKIGNISSSIIKIKDGYKLYCKTNCGFIIKICDSIGCYSFPFEFKLK